MRIERERADDRADRARGLQLRSLCAGLRGRRARLLQGERRQGRDHRLSRRRRGAGGARGRCRRHDQLLPAGRGAGGEEGHQGKNRRHRIVDAERLAHRGDEQFTVPGCEGPRRQEDRRHGERQHHRLLRAVGGQPRRREGRDHPGRRAVADPDAQVGPDRRRRAQLAAAVPDDPAGRRPLARRPRQGNAADPAGRVGGDPGTDRRQPDRRSRARCARSTRRPPT